MNILYDSIPIRLLFTGDSITDCGRDYACNGEDLGDGYVRQVDALVRAHYSLSIEILNTVFPVTE